jgi:hypothetical protein
MKITPSIALHRLVLGLGPRNANLHVHVDSQRTVVKNGPKGIGCSGVEARAK